MSRYILGFKDINSTNRALVGGKGGNLAELTKIEGIRVPAGFCISTGAFKRIIGEMPGVNELIDQLANLKAADRRQINALGSGIRHLIEETVIPKDIENEIKTTLSRFGKEKAYAVRSSATAEDLPVASFAGQQDTYLNVIGEEPILEHISKCWASLFTDRASVYRIQNGFDHRKVYLSVIVQEMVFPEAAGILFTADPATCNRKVVAIDAGFGLGEALVSGMVNADHYKVQEGKPVEKRIAAKKTAVQTSQTGGTEERAIEPSNQSSQVLTDEQMLELAQLGRKIEAHFGNPQDIEWCLAENTFYIVQSRPITTLYPIPQTNNPENAALDLRVYVSVGHQQMMTDAMKPLGLSVWLLTTPATMRTAGGRLFVDITQMLASPEGRDTLLNTLGKSDPLIKDALTTLLNRPEFNELVLESGKTPEPDKANKPPVHRDLNARIDYDPELVPGLIKSREVLLEELKLNIEKKSGSDVLDFILEDIQREKKNIADQRSFAVLMTGIHAAAWINEKMNEWLGEKNAADTLSQSVPNNVTAKMGLALMDVADVIRPHPEVIGYLKNVKQDNFLEELPQYNGGEQARNAIDAFLKKYGMRCAGEIDITRTRWIEKPATLIPVILGNIKNFEAGAGPRKFEQGRQEALRKEQDLLARLRHMPDGQSKATETKRMIELLRNFAGYREYPKYSLVCRYFEYKQAILKEAERLVQAGVFREKEDAYYLTFEELREVVYSNALDYQTIEKRKEEFKIYEKLTPPRVMTSDGEVIKGTYKHEDIPDGAIAGLAVSSGITEGRARVILDMEKADLEEGDILITTFTDPSWTPLFVSIKGLVTEVGGLMTHGAVIAREYGLPAVVGVENATKLIQDGQQIRVNGTDGYIELLT